MSNQNQINVIAPYWLDTAKTWVFDDDAVGLRQEPFVEGIPEMMDTLTADIPNAREGFRLTFSGEPFPGHLLKLDRGREECGGWWYSSEAQGLEGWLCPAMFRYFTQAPVAIYVKAEAIDPVVTK